MKIQDYNIQRLLMFAMLSKCSNSQQRNVRFWSVILKLPLPRN